MMQKLSLAHLSLIGAVVPTIILIVMTLAKTGGVWEYALDDVYIHLAMSEQIAHGGYGVNEGEYASASSSILYSYLLVPFDGFSWHSFWPLVMGLGALVVAALLWARVLEASAQNAEEMLGRMLLVLAVLGPAVLHFHAMSLIGMEHMLHVVVTLLALLGLIEFVRDGRVGWMLVVGLVLNPVLRFEGLAITILGCCVLFFGGRKRASIIILAAAFAPLVAHFLLMGQLGLDSLPNSVNAKAAITGGGHSPVGAEKTDRIAKLLFSGMLSLASPSGRTLIFAILIASVGLFLARHQIKGRARLLGIMVVLAMLGHLLLGSTTAFYRYEVYVWTFAIGAGVYLFSQLEITRAPFDRALPVLLTGAVLYGGVHYPISAFTEVPAGGAAIHAQQRQMGNFVDRYWRAPVAVNDLGHVAYRNPYYVLDLWGLASADALEARLRGDDPLWADKLAHKYGVDAAMVYDHWFKKDIPATWTPVAKLILNIPRATLGGNIVTIYATRPEAAELLTDKLRAFEGDLSPSARLKFNEEG